MYYMPVNGIFSQIKLPLDTRVSTCYNICVDRLQEKALWAEYRRTKDKSKIVDAYIKLVYQTANLIGNSLPVLDRDQLLSDMQMCLLESIDKWRQKHNVRFHTYLMRGLHRRGAYLLRKLKKPSTPVNLADWSSQAEPPEQEHAFRQNIVKIILENRACVPPHEIFLVRSVYCYEPKKTMAEIALMTGHTEDEVSKRIARTLKKLMKAVTK